MSLNKSIQIIKTYRADPIAFFERQFKQNGHRTVLDILGKKMIILSHPDDVLYVLKENNQAYSRGRTAKVMKEFLGDGLLTNDGDLWRQQHRLIRPIMNLKSTLEFGPKIHETAGKMLGQLDIQKPIDAFREMNLLTWRIVLKTLFSQEATPALDAWLEDVMLLMGYITDRTRSAVRFPKWFPTPQNLKARAAYRKFEKFVYQLIEERKQKSVKERDLLQLLLDIQDEEDSNKRMSRELIKDEILTFLMAGHETITNTMTWTMILLAQHPQYLNELRVEADEFMQTKDYATLNSSVWMTAVIDESMRVWPPVWAFMRMAEKDDRIGELEIPAGTNVVLSPYLSHRAADVWDNPTEFRPERFFEKIKRPQGSFYPFGLGPRACIGAYFAGMEAKIILAHLVHEFDWSIIQPEVQRFEASITLRPLNNCQMQFRKRS